MDYMATLSDTLSRITRGIPLVAEICTDIAVPKYYKRLAAKMQAKFCLSLLKNPKYIFLHSSWACRVQLFAVILYRQSLH